MVTEREQPSIHTLWRIELLGWLQARQGERVLTRFRSHKTGSLLAFLAYYADRSHPREVLIERLWPEGDPAAGRNRLRQSLSSLRRQLEPPEIPAGSVILADRYSVRLNPDACLIDVRQFEGALNAACGRQDAAGRAEHLASAVAYYRGALLPGFCDDWVLEERQRLAEAQIDALSQLSALSEEAGDWPTAIQYARRAVGADPLWEDPRATLIRLLVAAGHEEAARQQLLEFSQLLARELGAEPSEELQALLRERNGPRRRLLSGGSGSLRLDRGGSPAGSDPLSHVVPAAPPGASNAVSALDLAARDDPLPAATGCPGVLPLQFTRFFGREAEIETLLRLLSNLNTETRRHGEEHGVALVPILPGALSSVSPCLRVEPGGEPRLITLTGPGGSGKTRLALAVAGQLRGAFPGGVWFVPLADSSNPHLVPDRVRAVMGLPRLPNLDPLDQVVHALSVQPALLVLDNLEHLLPEGAAVAQTLRERVESLWILVTSRRTLALPGEQEFPVAPLPVPGVSEQAPGVSGTARPSSLTPDACSLATNPSIALFIDRAQAVRPDFQITSHNAAALAELCRRIEGLPLAIELAAARAGVLTPSQMLERLNERFELLVSRQRGGPPRHRSLRAALDWSYRLLSPELQRFFTHLSVFRGGFTLEAAEAIAECRLPMAEGGMGRDGTIRPPPSSFRSALDGLEQLRECSLVEPAGSESEPRFRLLETLREFGQEQLGEAERTALERRRLEYFTRFTEGANAALDGPEQGVWLERLEREHDNLRAALSWSLENSEAPLGLQLGASLWRFWQVRGYLTEGRDWLARLLRLSAKVLPHDTRERSPAHARALQGLGLLASEQGDYRAARGCFEESLLIWKGLNDKRAEASLLYDLADIDYYQGEYAAARRLYEECLAIQQAVGDRRGIAMSLDSLGTLSHKHGNFHAARLLYEESLKTLRELGDHEEMAYTLQHLGYVESVQDDHAAARAHFEESLAFCQALGSKDGTASAFSLLSYLAFREGDFETARTHAEKHLVIEREIGRRRGIAAALYHLGRALRGQGHFQSSASAHEESLWIWRELNDVWSIAKASVQLAAAVLAQGDTGVAHPLFAESLKVLCGMGEMLESQECLEGLAKIASVQGQVRNAARLFGAAEAMRSAIGTSLPPSDRADHDRHLESVRTALGEATFAALSADGRGLTLEQATALALKGESRRGPGSLQETPAGAHGGTPDSQKGWPRGNLCQEEWDRIAPLLPTSAGRRGRPYEDHRRVVNGILWVLRTGAVWRDLPARYGGWKTCHERYRRWRRSGLWEQIEQALHLAPGD